jgi:hypothetical protein
VCGDVVALGTPAVHPAKASPTAVRTIADRGSATRLRPDMGSVSHRACQPAVAISPSSAGLAMAGLLGTTRTV